MHGVHTIKAEVCKTAGELPLWTEQGSGGTWDTLPVAVLHPLLSLH